MKRVCDFASTFEHQRRLPSVLMRRRLVHAQRHLEEAAGE